ncbi:MAG: ABC transporter ATP-binding protein [Acidobacteria bacterium]|nr:ABC transporter ATP-binding protein [Acidobacteriota bacterium]
MRERPGWFRRGARREVPAVRGVSLSVARGEVVGLLGPNGAGKTTLLKIISTLLLPDEGTVRMAGADIVRQPREARRRLGLVPVGDRSLHWKLTGAENLDLYGGLFDLPRAETKRRASALLAKVGLADFAHVAVEKYSTGMRKRLMLSRALLHEPSVLILDEPTAGLDVAGKRDLWALLRSLAGEVAVTVLLATHDMEEAETVPDRLVMICSGRLHAEGTPADLRAKAALLRRFPEAIRVERREPNLGDVFLALAGAPLGDAE